MLIKKTRLGGRKDTDFLEQPLELWIGRGHTSHGCISELSKPEARGQEGLVLIPEIPDGRTHSGCTPFVMEAAPPGKPV